MAQSLGNLATTTDNVRFINLNRVGITGTGAVPGAVFNGPAGGETGFSVASAGNWNGSSAGLSDIMIGSPGATVNLNTDSGQVNLFYGATISSANYLTGTYNLANLPTSLPNVVLTGANAGDMAGYALSPTGIINPGQPNTILIGAPGYNSDAGTAYLIPGRAAFTGSYSLSAAETNPLDGNQYVYTSLNPPAAPTSSAHRSRAGSRTVSSSPPTAIRSPTSSSVRLATTLLTAADPKRAAP